MVDKLFPEINQRGAVSNRENVINNCFNSKGEVLVRKCVSVELSAIAVAVMCVSTLAKDEVYTLDTMTITATKSALSSEKSPVPVSVMNQRDLEKRGTNDIDQALKYVPGLYAKRSKGLMESMAGTQMRGFAKPEQVLVLLDGQPMNNGYVGRVQYNDVSVADLNKVEVIKGPFSSLYGGSAVGGVVSLTTAEPDSAKVTLKTGYGSYDSWNMFGAYQDRINDKFAFKISFTEKYSGGYETDDLVITAKEDTSKAPKGTVVTGWEKTKSSKGADSYKIGDKGRNGAESRNASAKLFFSPNEMHKISLGTTYSNYHYFRDNGISYLKDVQGKTIDTGAVLFSDGGKTYKATLKQSGYINGDGGSSSLFTTLGYKGILSDHLTLQFTGGLSNQFENWYITPSSSATFAGGEGKFTETPNMRGNADLNLLITDLIPKNELLVGFAGEGAVASTRDSAMLNWTTLNSMDSVQFKCKGKTGSGAFYLQDKFEIIDKELLSLDLHSGVRADYWKTFDGYYDDKVAKKRVEFDEYSETAISPRFALVSNFKTDENLFGTTVRASWGKAFSAPTSYDLYRTWVSSTGVVYESNPELKPEYVSAWEAGADFNFLQKKIALGATYYNNTIENMVFNKNKTTDATGKVTSIIKSNAGEGETKGVETSFAVTPIKDLKLFATYTWTDAKLTKYEQDTLQEGKYLVNVPNDVAGLGVDYSWKMIDAGMGWRYVSKRYRDAMNADTVSGVYGSADEYQVVDARIAVRPTSKLTLSVSADNLFDKKYYDYYLCPGRTISGDIKVEF